jgi:hypothetical protein
MVVPADAPRSRQGKRVRSGPRRHIGFRRCAPRTRPRTGLLLVAAVAGGYARRSPKKHQLSPYDLPPAQPLVSVLPRSDLPPSFGRRPGRNDPSLTDAVQTFIGNETAAIAAGATAPRLTAGCHRHWVCQCGRSLGGSAVDFRCRRETDSCVAAARHGAIRWMSRRRTPLRRATSKAYSPERSSSTAGMVRRPSGV